MAGYDWFLSAEQLAALDEAARAGKLGLLTRRWFLTMEQMEQFDGLCEEVANSRYREGLVVMEIRNNHPRRVYPVIGIKAAWPEKEEETQEKNEGGKK